MLCWAQLAYAQPGRFGQQKRAHPREEIWDNLSEELNLSPQQQEQLQNQRNEQRKNARALRESLRSKQKQLRKELDQQDIDRAKIDSLMTEINSLNKEQLSQRVQGILSMRQILSSEQFKKLQEKKAVK
ncbi:MAG: periplasmic heavy metal sensor [Candidatus Omnitrophica bacterium]|nr:periplasmic heavy metal sensor [Candidatus Omnitrophota bacterium]